MTAISVSASEILKIVHIFYSLKVDVYPSLLGDAFQFFNGTLSLCL